MAIARVATQDATGSGTTSATATYAATPTQGDLLIAVVYEGNGLAQSPSGWSSATGQVITQLGTQAFDIFYKVAGAAESTTVTTAVDAGSTSTGIQIYEYNGFTGTPTLDKTAGTTSGAATALTVSTGTTATTTAAAELLITVGGFASAETFSSWTNSIVNRNAIPSASTKVFIGDLVVAATGAYTSTLTVTGSATTNGGSIATFKDVVAAVTAHNLMMTGVGS